MMIGIGRAIEANRQPTVNAAAGAFLAGDRHGFAVGERGEDEGLANDVIEGPVGTVPVMGRDQRLVRRLAAEAAQSEMRYQEAKLANSPELAEAQPGGPMRKQLNSGGINVPRPDRERRLIHTNSAPVRGRAYRWRLPAAAMLAVDLLSALIALELALAIFDGILAGGSAGAITAYALPGSILLVSTQAALGLYATPAPGPCAELRTRVLAAAIVAGAGLMGMLPLAGVAISALWVVTGFGLLLVLGYYGGQLAAAALSQAGARGASTAVIGTGETARAVAAGLMEHPDAGLRPIGFVALPDQLAIGMELPLPLLCRLEHAAAVEPVIDVGVLAMPLRERSEIEAELGQLPFRRITFIKDLDALHARRFQPVIAFDGPVRQCMSAGATPAARATKRAIDLLIAVPIALMSMPLVLLVAAAVLLADPGPVLFRQQRIGLGGRPFDVFKIRSMYQDAERRLEKYLAADPALAAEWKSHFKLENDPRILPGIGRFIRRFSLDELPQLWNVIRGDMSLVGPRPFPAYHLTSFDDHFRALRSTVMPGLTGLWQISARSAGDTAVQRAQDTLYIEHWSHWLDLHILLQTVPAVICAKGAK